MEGVEDGVISWNFALVKRRFSQFHGAGNMLNVVFPAQKTSTGAAPRVGSFDFHTAHFTFISPRSNHLRIVQKRIETQETEVDEVVVIPLFQPFRFTLQCR